MLDAKWLEALSLPSKVTGGLCLFFIAALVIDAKLLPLLAPEWVSLFYLGALLTGCLFVAAMGALGIQAYRERNKPSLLALRRKTRKAEQEEEKKAAQRRVLQRLDALSKDEIHYVAKALRDGSQSFTAYANAGAISNMMLKSLVQSPGGTHHQDHYPFSFPDFVWVELTQRRTEFIAKDDEFKRQALEERPRGRGR